MQELQLAERRVAVDGSRTIFGRSLTFVLIGLVVLITWSGLAGAAWKERQTDQDLNGVTSGEGRLVAVGDSGTLMFSEDRGESWERVISAASVDQVAVAYGGGRFVAVGQQGVAQYSDDGRAWTLVAASLGTADLRAVRYLNGRFFAFGATGQTYWTSANGASWTQHTLSITETIYDAAYGGGVYLMIGQSGRLVRSTDGVSWTAYFMAGSTVHLYSVIYADGRFLVGGNDGGIFRSTDGMTWSRDADIGSAVYELAYDGRHYFAVEGYDVNRSADGVSWTGVGSAGVYLYGVTTVDSQLVAVGQIGRVLKSEDGLSWLQRGTATTETLASLIYADGRFIAGGYNGSVLRSDDGLNWNREQGIGSRVQDIAFDGSRYFAIESDDIQTSADGTVWTEVYSSGSSLYGLAAGGGGIVAVGYSGTVVYRSNAPSWALGLSATNHHLRDVAYGNGRFVAVGDAGAIQRSTDGQTWTLASATITADLIQVVYAGSKFIALAANGDLWQSPDGAAWTYVSARLGARSLTYSEGTYILVGQDGGIWRSGNLSAWTQESYPSSERDFETLFAVDGFVLAMGARGLCASSGSFPGWIEPPHPGSNLTWVERQTNQPLRGVTYGEGHMVAVGDAGTLMLSSDGGGTWERVASAASVGQTAVAYGSGRFVAVGKQGVAQYSEDGRTWNLITAALGSADLRAVRYLNGRFFVLGDTGQSYWTSADGVSWTERSAGISEPMYDIAYGGGYYLMVGQNSRFARSTDGVGWSANFIVGSTEHLYSAIYADGRFVAGGSGGGIFRATDAVSWSRDADLGSAVSEIVYDGSQYIAVEYYRLYRSSDAVAWTEAYNDGGNTFYGLVAGGGHVVGVGDGGRIISSEDGLAWQSAATATTEHLQSIAYADGRFMAGGYDGGIFRSPDGLAWSRDADIGNAVFGVVYFGNQYFAIEGDDIHRSSEGVAWAEAYSSGSQLYGLAAGGGRIVAVGYNGAVFYSADGQNWSTGASATTRHLRDVVYGNGLFVAIGDAGTVQTSTDGQVWTLQDSRTDANLLDVTYSSPEDGTTTVRQFVAIGERSTIARSTNGVDWVADWVPLGSLNGSLSPLDASSVTINGISSGANGLVAVGQGGLVWHSLNGGESWSVTTWPVSRSARAAIQRGSTVYSVGDSGLLATAEANQGGDCSQGPVNITGVTYIDTHQIRSETTISAGGASTGGATGVTVAAGADVSFQATTRIRLYPNFQVRSGSRFMAAIAPVVCPATTLVTLSRTATSDSELASSADDEGAVELLDAKPLSFEGLSSALLERLTALGASAADIADLHSDASGERIVFASQLALVTDDDNGQSDVYLYQAQTDTLELVSRAWDGTAADGASDQPRIGGWGDYVVYRSSASDLTSEADGNGVADIFLQELASGVTKRVSWGETGEESREPSANPDLSGASLEIVYDRGDAASGSAVWSYAPDLGNLAVREDAGTCAAHHPALSADGRYLAYLCGAPSEAAGCSVQFVDRESGRKAEEPCPAVGDEAGYRLDFDTRAEGLYWLGATSAELGTPSWTANPLSP